MNRPPLSQLHGYLRNVTDKRQAGKVLHKLEDILFIAVVATIANASCWEEVADFAKTRVNWLRQYIELPGGAPSHDTFERTFKWIDGKQFERCFILWMREVCQEKGFRVIAMDGKTMRGSGDKALNKRPLHIVSAWTSENNMVLGQVKTEEKSNEIDAIPRLLELLDVRGAVVTIDAIGTQKQIADQIISQQADYILSVKKNQRTMYEDIETLARMEGSNGYSEISHEYYKTLEKGHGRIEEREYWLIPDVKWASWYGDWKGLGAIGIVKRRVIKGSETSEEMAYYITSLKKNVQQFATGVRSHWGIESMHWTLDVVLNEDRRIVRKDNGPRNLAVLKRMAFNIIRADTTFEKASGSRKRFRACMNTDYLETVLSNM
ncbi:MAG: ISAs1 family transposase [Christensenellales bacterium]